MLCHTGWLTLTWLNFSHKWHLVILLTLVHGKQKQVSTYVNSNNLHVWIVPQKLSYNDFKLMSKWPIKEGKVYGYYIQKHPWNRVPVSVSTLIVDDATRLSQKQVELNENNHAKYSSHKEYLLQAMQDKLALLCVWKSAELLFGTIVHVNHAYIYDDYCLQC